MSSAYENEMSDLEAENYTQEYPVKPYWEEAMTPTEQDKELREQIVAVMFEDEWFHCSEHGSVICAEANDERTKALNKITPLITADRKRVALEARLQEVEVSIIELERSDDPRFYSKDEAIRSQRARYTQLKAQQEEVNE